jgi:hypothetical protein
MIDFFYSKQPRFEGANNEDYEALEMSVEKLSSKIDDLRHSRAQRKNQLNLLYNKFELMSSELQLFQLEIEDRKNFDLTILPTDLIVPEKERLALLEERKRLEEDLTRSMLADKRKKVTKEDLRNFKKQFKDSVAFYDIWGYTKSTDNGFLKHQEELWKNLLLEYSQHANKAFEIQEFLEQVPNDKNLKEELQFLNHRLAAIEQRIRASKDRLDTNSNELGSIYKDLGIPLDRHIDKGYKINYDELERMLIEENPDRRKVALAYFNYKIFHDAKDFLELDHREMYQTLFNNVRKTIDQAINEFDCEKDKYEAIHQEYLLTVHILCKLNSMEDYCTSVFDREETQRLVAELFQYFNAKDETV